MVGRKGRGNFFFPLGCILEAQFDMLRNNYYSLNVNNSYSPLILIIYSCIHYLTCFDVYICLFFLNFCFHVLCKCLKFLIDWLIELYNLVCLSF